MTAKPVAEAIAPTPQSRRKPDVTRRSQWLKLARLVWILLALLTLSLVVAAFLYRLNRPWRFDPADQEALRQLGLSTTFYSNYFVTFEFAIPLVWFLTALFIFWRKSNDGPTLFFALVLLTYGVTISSTFSALGRDHPIWRLPHTLLTMVGLSGSFISFYVFPDGRFVPRWTRFAAAACVVWVVFERTFVYVTGLAPLQVAEQFGELFLGVQTSLLLSGVIALLYRYRRVSVPPQRQQIKWVVFAMVSLVLGNALDGAFYSFVYPSSPQPGMYFVLYGLFGTPLVFFGPRLFLALAIAFSVLRYRLWDVDFAINRSLVYTALTVSVISLYVLIVGSLGRILQTSLVNSIVPFAATGVVALVFQPMRDWFQRAVNHLMYGERDEPYAVLTRLGHRLESTLAPEAVFTTIVQTVAESLKLPYASVELSSNGEHRLEVAFPPTAVSPPAGLITLPLTYQGETIGLLRLAPRAPGEDFSPADRMLLEDFARQAGVAAHAIRLTADLQQARERIVTAREEERRRMRRDLHDGLGAQLAALNMQVGAIQKTAPHDPPKASAMLEELRSEIKASITNIRRIVYDLRPPALDELGLLSTLRDQVMHFQDCSVHFRTDLPESLPPLPAAVEVAVYRIAQEALTNVARHSQAYTCTLRLSLGDELELEIHDDGTGLPAGYNPGVGLRSMRERAEELGGRCQIDSAPDGGTRVMAYLPIMKQPDMQSSIGI